MAAPYTTATIKAKTAGFKVMWKFYNLYSNANEKLHQPYQSDAKP